MQETNLAKDGSSIGTTKKGIGPAYASKASRNGLRIGNIHWMLALSGVLL
jgi:adenylosuccinate synthase